MKHTLDGIVLYMFEYDGGSLCRLVERKVYITYVNSLSLMDFQPKGLDTKCVRLGPLEIYVCIVRI